MVIILLVVYGVWDTFLHARESPRALQFDRTHIKPLRLQGGSNLCFLGLEAGIAMPSFFGYMRYSGLILLPLFAGITRVVF